MSLTKMNVREAAATLERMKASAAKVRKSAEEMTGDVVLGAEAGATSYFLGYSHMRWGENGELKVLGLPVDVGVAVGMAGLYAMGALGKQSEHGRNVAVGALSLLTGRMGAEAGAKAAAEDRNSDTARRSIGSGGKTAGGLGAGAVASGSATGAGAGAGQTYVVSEKG
jgi:hypothetical protein